MYSERISPVARGSRHRVILDKTDLITGFLGREIVYVVIPLAMLFACVLQVFF